MPHDRTLRAVVVGGGIGGLASAAALVAAGCDVVVLERSRELREVGAGLTLWPNALRALRALDLAGEVERLGAVVESGAFIRADGRVLSRETVDLRAMYGLPAICVRRRDLVATLAGALPEGVVRLGAQVTGCERRSTGAAARLADGTYVEGDLLVGADGIRSIVRTQLGRSGPRHAGALAWRGTVAGEFGAAIMVGDNAHAGWLPMTPGETYWFASVNTAEGEAPAPGGVPRELRGHFGSWGEPLASILDRTPADRILFHELYEHEPAGAATAPWGDGRVTLLGDAAHAMTPGLGQGACAALEDAVVLGTRLRDAARGGEEVAVSLRAYEQERRPRTARLQGESLLALRALQPRSRIGQAIRDVVLRAPARWVARRQAWIFRWEPADPTPLVSRAAPHSRR